MNDLNEDHGALEKSLGKKRPKTPIHDSPPAKSTKVGASSTPNPWKEYMENKDRKLHAQFSELHAGSEGAEMSAIFKGVSIWVNGYTEPSSLELRRLICLHGGMFEYYYSKSKVTHVIATNLPDTKYAQFKNDIVVTPDWIVDSIREGRMLPHTRYTLSNIRDKTQRGLHSFVSSSAMASPIAYLANSRAARPPHHQPSTPTTPPPLPAPAPSQTSQSSAAAALTSPVHQLPSTAWMGDGGGVVRRKDPQPDTSRAAPQSHQPGPCVAPAAHLDHALPSLCLAHPPTCRPDTPSAQQTTSHDSFEFAEDDLHAPSRALLRPPSPRHGSLRAAQAADKLWAGEQDLDDPGAPRPSGGGSGQQEQGDATPAAVWDTTAGGPERTEVTGTEANEGVGEEQTSSAVSSGGTHDGAVAAQVHVHGEQAAGAATSAPSCSDARASVHGIGAAAPSHPSPDHDQRAPHRVLPSRLLPKKMPRGSSEDEHFMEKFFQASRLHHIGSWRARYQQLAQQLCSGPRASLSLSFPPAASNTPVIMHVDMDCFFASVATRDKAHLQGKPVAVCHSNAAGGTGEVSSANYEARKYGITAGMFIGEAKRRCPHLIVVPYLFADYEQVSDAIYTIFFRYTSRVQAVSCDEAYLDMSGVGDGLAVAAHLREEILKATRCTASAGIGPNMLLARLATKKAKPNGHFEIKKAEARNFLDDLPISELPGVGWAMGNKFESLNISKCGELIPYSKEWLQKQFGKKNGSTLYSFVRGDDERQLHVQHDRKSLGAEVNWGIRFDDADQPATFVENLAQEVAKRLRHERLNARTVTLKIKRRFEHAPEPHKLLGHGLCHNLSRSTTLGSATDDAATILRECKVLLAQLSVPYHMIRGIGIHMARITSVDSSKAAQYQSTLFASVPPSLPSSVRNSSPHGPLLHAAAVTFPAPYSSLESRHHAPPEPPPPDPHAAALPAHAAPHPTPDTTLNCPAPASNATTHVEEDVVILPRRAHSAPCASSSPARQVQHALPHRTGAKKPAQRATPAPPHPDPNFLDALPQDIRNEVLQDLASHLGQCGMPPVPRFPRPAASRPTHPASRSDGIKSASTAAPVQACSNSCHISPDASVQDVICWLRHRVDNHSPRASLDASSLSAFVMRIQQLITTGSLEQGHQMLLAARRVLERDQALRHLFNTLLPHVQSTAREVFGGPLALPPLSLDT